MTENLFLVYGAIIVALFFDFINGFHDSANSIATVVGTRALRPLHAVSMAAIANFIGPFIFGTAVAATVGKDIIQPEFSTVYVIIAGLIGAISWNLITWYFGLPSSSSHALIGGLIGAGLAAGGTRALIFPGIEKILLFMVVSPMMGFVIAFVLTISIMYFLRKNRPSTINRLFAKLQIASSAFFSLTHGANDGQKTMGVITALLISAGLLDSRNFVVPIPVILGCSRIDCIRDIFWRMANREDYGLQTNNSKIVSRILC